MESRQLYRCEGHDLVMVMPSQLKPRKPLKRGGPLRRTSKKTEAAVRRRGSTLKQGRGFAASKAQREKVAGLPCINCGREASEYVAIDPAHLWPRGMGGCDDELCVGPLCRDQAGGCHRLFDEGKLDILAKLIDRGYFAEMGHAIAAHELSPLTLLKRLTGQEWTPVESPLTTRGAAPAALGRSST